MCFQAGSSEGPLEASSNSARYGGQPLRSGFGWARDAISIISASSGSDCSFSRYTRDGDPAGRWRSLPAMPCRIFPIARSKDVVHFVVPAWPTASAEDVVLCSEVKTKSTDGASTPIKAAIEDSFKDRTSRLARTLVWLRERALTDDLGDVSLQHLDRFINATEHPAAQKRFRAVAVVSADLVEAEVADAPTQAHPEYTVVVISVPDLQATYTSVFAAARQAIAAAEAKIPA